MAGYCVNLAAPHHAYPAERRVRGLYWSTYFGVRQLLVGRSVQFEGLSSIRIGHRVRINDSCQFVAGTHGAITIGDDCHTARFSLLAGGGGISIGKRCMISSYVAIYSVQNQIGIADAALKAGVTAPVTIGDDVFIGVGAIILPGVTIGDSAVIAAGALVNRDVASQTVVAGVPAKPVPKNASEPSATR